MAHAKVSQSHPPTKSDQQLRTLLAAVLAHPDTPSDVCNAVTDALADLGTSGYVLDEAPAIQAVLDKARAAKPKVENDEESKTTLDQVVRRRGVPCRIVGDFLDELYLIHECLKELAMLTACQDAEATPSLNALLLDQYRKVTDRFREEMKQGSEPLAEGGAS